MSDVSIQILWKTDCHGHNMDDVKMIFKVRSTVKQDATVGTVEMLVTVVTSLMIFQLGV